MALSVNISSFTQTDAGFEATGTVADKPFTSRTIKFAGDLIFKIMEPDEDGKLVLKTMADSEFSRGERIAVARFLKGTREDFEKSTVLSVEELSALDVPALRTLAKDRGISGYYAKGVTKADLVALLSPVADAVEVDAAPEVDAAAEVEVDAASEVEVEVEAAAEVEVDVTPVIADEAEAPPAK